jgi:cyclopropane fatty-acyl-phospholipid synthase-like methyltransferase
MQRDWRKFWAEQSDPRHPYSADFLVNHGGELALVCGETTGKRVLELGCGSGTLFDVMGLEKASLYRGVDFSAKMLAAFLSTHPTVDVACADASSYVDQGQYDLIFSNQMVQYFSAKMFRAHLANARRMLSPGGRLVVGSIPWRGARNAFYLQAYDSGSRRRRLRQLAVLARAYIGIDQIGRWYSFRECKAEARRHGLTVAFFGCLQFPYRFHLRLDDPARA